VSAVSRWVDVAHLTVVHRRHDTRIFVKEARSLAASGLRVGLLVMDGLGDDERDGVDIRDLGPPPATRLRRFCLGSLRTLRAIRRLQPRVVHFHDPELIPVAVLIRLMGIRVVYDVHEDLPRQVAYKRWIPRRARRGVAVASGAIEGLAAAVFDRIVAATPVIAARFPASKVVMVRNFPILAEMAQPAAVPISDRGAIVAYVGGYQTVRGIDQMVDALQHCPPQVELWMAGRFDSEAVAGCVRSKTGWSRVRDHGWLDREGVANLLASACVGVVILQPVQNLEAAYPVKLFEYMAAGLPVIASDFPAWRDLLSGTDCALFVDPTDPEAIASAIETVTSDRALATKLGENGRLGVERHYSWATEETALLDSYTPLLA